MRAAAVKLTFRGETSVVAVMIQVSPITWLVAVAGRASRRL
jgi:hypothetical protein